MAEFIEFSDTEGRLVSLRIGLIQHIRYQSDNVTEILLNNGDRYKVKMPYKNALDWLDMAVSGRQKP